MSSAGLAGIAVLVRGLAERAGALDEAVRQEHAFLLVVGLFDGLRVDVAGIAQRLEHLDGQRFVLGGMRRVEVVEIDAERREVAHELLAHSCRELLGCHAQFACLDHDRRAVRVAGADVSAIVAAELLEAYPDVRLDVFDEMPHVNGAVGIRQGARNEDFSGSVAHGARLCHGFW
jgi:hypothetical protein